MKDNQINTFSKGLRTDFNVLNVGNDMYIDLVNGTLLTNSEDQFILQNLKGTAKKASLKDDYEIMGWRVYNNICYILSAKFDDFGAFISGEIGSFPSPDWDKLNSQINKRGIVPLTQLNQLNRNNYNLDLNYLGDQGIVNLTLTFTIDVGATSTDIQLSSNYGVISPNFINVTGQDTITVYINNLDLSTIPGRTITISIVPLQALITTLSFIQINYVFITDNYRQRVPLEDVYRPFHNFSPNQRPRDIFYNKEFNTPEFNFKKYQFCEVQLQPEFDRSINVIFTDNYNPIRIINSRFIVYADNTAVLAQRNTPKDSNVYDAPSFYLTELVLKNNKIPKLTFEGLVENGRWKAGGYKFFFYYANEVRNTTDLIEESRLIPLVDTTGNLNAPIGGNQDKVVNKSIKFSVENLNNDFQYIIVRYAYYNGVVPDLPPIYYELSELFDIRTKRNNRSGIDLILTGAEEIFQIPSSTISTEFSSINTVKSITQYNDRLVFAGIGYNSFSVLDYFIEKSKQLIIKEGGEAVPKYFYHNPKNVHDKLAYWRGETYEIAIVWILKKDGSTLPPMPVYGVDNLYLDYAYGSGSGPENIDLATGRNSVGAYRTALNVDLVPSETQINAGQTDVLYKSYHENGVHKEEIYIKYLYLEENENSSVFSDPIIKEHASGYYLVRRKRDKDCVIQGYMCNTLPLNTTDGLDTLSFTGKTLSNSPESFDADGKTQVIENLTDIDEQIAFAGKAGQGVFTIPPGYVSRGNIVPFNSNNPISSLVPLNEDDYFTIDYSGDLYINDTDYIYVEGGDILVVLQDMVNTGDVVTYKFALNPPAVVGNNGSLDNQVATSGRSKGQSGATMINSGFLGTYKIAKPNDDGVKFVPHMANLLQADYLFNKKTNPSGFLCFIQAPSISTQSGLVEYWKYKPKEKNYLEKLSAAIKDKYKGKYAFYSSDIVANNAEIQGYFKNRQGKLVIGQPVIFTSRIDSVTAPVAISASKDPSNPSFQDTLIIHPAANQLSTQISDRTAKLTYVAEYVQSNSDGMFVAIADRSARIAYQYFPGDQVDIRWNYTPLITQYGAYIGVEWKNNNSIDLPVWDPNYNVRQPVKQTITRAVDNPAITNNSNSTYGKATHFPVGYIVSFYGGVEEGPMNRTIWVSKYENRTYQPYETCSPRFVLDDNHTNRTPNIYGGDCYISPSYKRISYMLGIPEAPQVTSGQYRDYIDGDRCVGLKPQGLVVELLHESDYNAAFRSLENADPVEKLIYGTDRDFYQIHTTEQIAGKKQLESKEYNFGYSRFEYPTQKQKIDQNLPLVQTYFPNRIAVSPKSSISLLSNNYRNLSGLNYRDYDRDMGFITAIRTVGNYVYVVMDHGVAIVPIEEKNIINSETGEISVNTGEILYPKLSPVSREFGSTMQWSVKETSNALYGYDWLRNRPWQIISKSSYGQTSPVLNVISVFQVQDRLNKIKNNIELLKQTDKYDPIVFTIYEAALDTIHFNLQNKLVYKKDSEIVNINEQASTLMYSETLQFWVGRHNINPKFSFNINGLDYTTTHHEYKDISGVSVSNQIAMLQSDEVSRCNFYNKQYTFEVEFVLNKQTSYQKVLNNLKIISNSVSPEVIEYSVMEERFNIVTNQPRPIKYIDLIKPREKGFNIVEHNSEYKEDHHYIEVMKATSRGSIQSEEQVRDKAIAIRIIYKWGGDAKPETTKVIIQAIASMFNYSYN